MKNSEKFVAAQERAKALLSWCKVQDKDECQIMKDGYCFECAMKWLDLEAEEEKPLPCPFCGGRCSTNGSGKVYQVACKETCGYVSTIAETESEAIAAHNRVAKAVRESEGK